jgi:hypothetical protein
MASFAATGNYLTPASPCTYFVPLFARKVASPHSLHDAEISGSSDSASQEQGSGDWRPNCTRIRSVSVHIKKKHKVSAHVDAASSASAPVLQSPTTSGNHHRRLTKNAQTIPKHGTTGRSSWIASSDNAQSSGLGRQPYER